jgi:hypothetical protein
MSLNIIISILKRRLVSCPVINLYESLPAYTASIPFKKSMSMVIGRPKAELLCDRRGRAESRQGTFAGAGAENC